MKVIIAGAGMVGTQLARHLSLENHDVLLIEADEEKARYAQNRIDCEVIAEEANSLATLEKAGLAEADALVCVTNSDELNMIICGIADYLNPDILKIARVRNDEYAKVSLPGERILGIDCFVHPDVAAAQSILNAVEHGAIGEVLAFSDTDFELGSIEIGKGSVLDGLELKDFRSIAPGDILITFIDRKEESFLPSGATRLAEGDRVHIFAPEMAMAAMFKLAGETEKKLLKIGIVGGGRVGNLIAEGLFDATKAEEPAQAKAHSGTNEKKQNKFTAFLKRLKNVKSIKDLKNLKEFKNFKYIPKNRSVVIIEQNYVLCKELSSRFPKAVVLNEDISDESFVTEEHINDFDLVITVTASQELNIVAAAYLKSRGVDRAIALVSGMGYAAIARQLGVDVVVPMNQVVVDSILSHLQGGGVRGVHRVGDGSVDIIEIEISPAAPIVDKPITAFHLTGGGLLMLVKREGESFIPHGDYVFKAGDHIILIAKNGSNAELEKFFGASE